MAVVAGSASPASPGGASPGSASAGSAAGAGPPGIAAISTPEAYLADRVAWIQQPSPGLFKYYCLRLTLSGFGTAPFVSYAGAAPGEDAVEVEYHPPGVSNGIFFPGSFTASRLNEAFSDRAYFDLDDRDEISVAIRFGTALSPPTILITLHRWGNTVVTFPVLGANDAQLHGNPDSRSHTTMMLTKEVCDGAI